MIKDINRLIDILNIRLDFSMNELIDYMRLIEEFRPRAIITSPIYLKTIKNTLRGSGITLGVLLDSLVSIYPYQDKIVMIRSLFDDGAKEIYTHISPVLYKERDFSLAEEEMNLLSSLSKRLDIKIIPIIDISLFSQNALSKLARLLKRYEFKTLAIRSNELIKDDDLITLRMNLNKDMRLAIIMDDYDIEEMAYYAKIGFRRFIISDMTLKKEIEE